jgi:FMN reductase [NAD(P)H]
MKKKETIDLLMNRSSLRNFSDRDVPDKVIETILKAGMQAATGGNLQPYSIIVLKNGRVKEKVASLFEGQPWVKRSPVHLIFLLDQYRMKRWAEAEHAPFTAMNCLSHFVIGMQDAIICAQNVCTAAGALGLGTVYIGTIIHMALEIKKLLKLPDYTFPVTLLCVGYPARGKRNVSPRLPYEAVVHEERYGDFTDEEVRDWYDDKYGHWKSSSRDLIDTAMASTAAVLGKRRGKKIEKLVGERGFITMAQRYFGTHYRADRMPSYDGNLIESIFRLGFRIGFRRTRNP